MIESYYKIKRDSITLYYQGISLEEIKNILKSLYPASTDHLTKRAHLVYRFVKKNVEYDILNFDRRKIGVVNKTILAFIERITERFDGFVTAKELRFFIRRYFNKDISISTISKNRKTLGFNNRKSRAKPKEFSEEEKNERLLFALNNLNDDFENTVFVDETSIQTCRSGLYHMRKKSKRPKVSSLKPRSVKTLNIWGGISFHGTTEFVMFTHTLNQDGYRFLINHYLAPFMRNYPGNCRLIQDNATPHSARSSIEFLNRNNIRWIKLPAYSPDINIIELVWGELKNYVRKKYCPDIYSLKARVNRFFTTVMTIEKCRSYVQRVKQYKMSKENCIILKVPNNPEKNQSTELEKYLGSLIYYPVDHLIGQDLAGLRVVQDISVNISFNCKRKKTILNCQVEDLTRKFAKPGIFMKIENSESNAVRSALATSTNSDASTFNTQSNQSQSLNQSLVTDERAKKEAITKVEEEIYSDESESENEQKK
ncbi:unnamed protein product [Brachionus calyciflorus]|uniref:Tc1-like transposase DDE domain-containing protein n=1 Tax=Brachionus calyciflorus TaxID=104777 RepID=A0A814LYW9_9BILA|nr:unnamed protein product [Brachionus calyciflorus]